MSLYAERGRRPKERQSIRLPLLLSVFLISCFAFGADSAASAPPRLPVLIDSDGLWSFARLGYPNQVLKGGSKPVKFSIPFRLPATAQQGEPSWYVVRLGFKIEIDPKSENGFGFVIIDTGGGGAGSISFETRRRNGKLTVYWSSVSILGRGGRPNAPVRFTTISDEFGNFLPLKGVRAGLNRLSIRLEQYRGLHVKRAVFFARRSGIERSAQGPATLKLDLSLGNKTPHEGDAFPLDFRIRNTGDRPAANVVVEAQTPSGGLTTVGSRSQRLGLIKAHETFSGHFRFRAHHKGQFSIAIFVSSSSNQPAKMVDVTVEPGGITGFLQGRPWWIWALLAAGLVGALSFGGDSLFHRSRIRRADVAGPG